MRRLPMGDGSSQFRRRFWHRIVDVCRETWAQLMFTRCSRLIERVAGTNCPGLVRVLVQTLKRLLSCLVSRTAREQLCKPLYERGNRSGTRAIFTSGCRALFKSNGYEQKNSAHSCPKPDKFVPESSKSTQFSCGTERSHPSSTTLQPPATAVD